MSEAESDRDSYKRLAAKYLRERDDFEELYRTVKIEAEGYWGCLQDKHKEIEGLIKQRDALLEVCEKKKKQVMAQSGGKIHWDTDYKYMEAAVAAGKE